MKSAATAKKPLTIGSATQEKIACGACKKTFTRDQLHSFGNGKKTVFLCTDCTKEVSAAYENETRHVNVPGGLMAGLAASAATGILWFFVTTATKTSYGIIAIGVAYAIAAAVVWGAGKKRGLQLQLMAVVLTVVTLLAADVAITAQLVANELGGMLGKTPTVWRILELGLLGTGEFHSVFMEILTKEMTSPIGILIRLYALYAAFQFPKARKIGA